METRNCQNCRSDFILDDDELSFYKKMKVLVPHICPTCRFKMRAMWRNEMSLYNRTCSVTGTSIISVYNPKSSYTVVSVEYYNSDKWDPRSFAMEYNYTRSFFEQFGDLLKNVYKKALNTVPSVGPLVRSEYVNFAGACKDSYFCFNTAYVENVLYAKGATSSKDSVDVYYVTHVENCYECVNVQKSNKIFYGKNSANCLDSILIEDCYNCTNCFGCVNLRNQSYHFFNEKLSKEEWHAKVDAICGSHENFIEARKKFDEFRIRFPKKLNQNMNTVGCTGDYLINSKNSHDCFEGDAMEDSRYLSSASIKMKDCYSGIAGIGGQGSLENVSLNHSSHVIGSILIENSQNIEYSLGLNNCKDCIGCDSLRNAQYCILNKQYSKEEYERIRQHIIEELTDKGIYGLMMPSELSPFGYNETIANNDMPLTKEEALKAGFRWEDDMQMSMSKGTLSSKDIPDHIQNVADSITGEILTCDICKRNYRLIDQELSFYRAMNIPVPRICFYCRHQDRIIRRGPYQFWNRNCNRCNKDIITNYAPNKPEIVYCEQCYRQEVI